MRDIANDYLDIDEPFTYHDVADGHVRIEISHAGGEMGDLQDDLNEELNSEKQRKRYDTRKRWDSVEKRWEATSGAFGEGLPERPEEVEIEKEYKLQVIDVFGTDTGLIPCAPWTPTLAVSVRVLELFRVARLRCPNLGVQNWVKTLTNLQCRPFKPYQMQQFTICFDLYLEILQNVEGRVKHALGRDAPDWRLKNCCPSCTYKLEGEAKLIFEMLGTGDGNDSLKPRRDRATRPRTADAGGDYYLSREKVDRWSKEVLAQQVQIPRSDDPEEDNLCQERWKNMSEEITERMWGIFDETGISSLCAAMASSSSLLTWSRGKYGLAIADSLLDAFGPDFGFGYDIGCGFEETIKNSPLGPKAKRLNFKMLVGSFHGHAHNRMCQLRYLATYVLGLGLEDLEGCERYFSRSNALARTVQYASVFHRKQSITTYLTHVDSFETYPNLSKFLVDNYKQALDILDTEEALTFAMDQAGISGGDEFRRRLEEEKAYLRSLSKEPEEETQQMEYYQSLMNLQARKKIFNDVFAEGSTANGTAKRHARDNYDKAHAAVQGMEQVLEIAVQWTPETEAWKTAALLVSTRCYRLCVNKLEELVLKRLFELTKMNMSQTGYTLRKHIAKALQVRSKTIRAALGQYNAAAAALTPKRRSLTWPEVIEYAFLSDFDILPDGFFLQAGACKGGDPTLNIEIRRLVTYICDEKALLLRKEAEVRETDPNLAYFIGKYRNCQGRSDDNHMVRLWAMAKKFGSRFTGTLTPGVRRTEVTEPVAEEMDVDSAAEEAEDIAVAIEIAREDAETDDDDEGEEAERETLAEMTERVLTIATDKE
ncbi:hypothetical protein B0H17DRAFT_1216483 [Mycena rosella]|uniref:CxC1-like cysteine cluster associated with KDZ transposases domain-containing protein n=1 Tax=Mycena rosella TaxID=1033263 RepID=A0AAD7FSL3_MYCRO|nr:hypothetical protein B0H17DRAFT_1216483 [Mycena rosella]